MQDELILFRKMQEGDWCAFNSFFESYSERLYLYALGFVGNRAEAEDIVQDTFIYLFVGESGEDYPFRFSLRLSESFCQEFLY